ncbi:MAG: hypothetical protein WAL16_12245, partial [Streptosporangiaceae bacterium]
IAERAGFGNAATFRHHFRAWRSTTPNAYRRTFRASQPRAAQPRAAQPRAAQPRAAQPIAAAG